MDFEKRIEFHHTNCEFSRGVLGQKLVSKKLVFSKDFLPFNLIFQRVDTLEKSWVLLEECLEQRLEFYSLLRAKKTIKKLYRTADKYIELRKELKKKVKNLDKWTKGASYAFNNLAAIFYTHIQYNKKFSNIFSNLDVKGSKMDISAFLPHTPGEESIFIEVGVTGSNFHQILEV